MVIIKDRREQQEAYAFFRIVSEAPGIISAVIIDEIAVYIFMFDYDGAYFNPFKIFIEIFESVAFMNVIPVAVILGILATGNGVGDAFKRRDGIRHDYVANESDTYTLKGVVSCAYVRLPDLSIWRSKQSFEELLLKMRVLSFLYWSEL